MRRAAATALVALAASAAALTHASAAVSPAWVRTASCSPATQSALFHARMKRVPGTARMALRFKLLERTAEGGWVRVEAPGLGRWRRSKADVAAFGHRQRVRNLAEGSIYRAKVDFRWTSRKGKTLLRLRRRSRPCRQGEALPNLRVTSVSLGPRADLPAGVWRYRATVRDSGKGKATGVAVRLAVDRTTVDTVVIPALEPGEAKTVEFTGPACERNGSPVKVTVDPEGAIPESREGDNSRRQTCGSLPR